MFDHILAFTDLAAAAAALEPLGYATTDEGAQLDSSRCMPVSLVVTPAEIDDSDPDNPVITPAVVLQGFYVVVATKEVDAALLLLPGNACRVVADRDAANAGSQDFITYLAPDVNLQALQSVTVSPSFAGSSYPFGDLGA